MNDKVTTQPDTAQRAKFKFQLALFMKSVGRDDEATQAWAEGEKLLDELSAKLEAETNV